MPSDVRKCLVDIITAHSLPVGGEEHAETEEGVRREAAERWLLKMEREKRYCVEAWS
jgi:sulfite reductase alpha subunit-like flavoprotein